jgi:hypothetical protein
LLLAKKGGGGKFSFFDLHRQFLTADHALRNDSNGFRAGVVVHNEPPPRLIGQQVQNQLNALKPSSNGNGFEGYREEHNWTHVPSLWWLPYLHKLLLPHNINVMHNEKNVAESIFSTTFDIPEKTKDNVKARIDQQTLCNRPALNMHHDVTRDKWVKPRASYYLNRAQKREILEWFQELKFPDGYATNL